MNEFAMSNLTAGQLNAIVKKLGGEEGAMSFLRGELVVSTQGGTTSPEGETRFVFSKVSQLGMKGRRITTQDILARIREIGEVCKPADGPAVQLASKKRAHSYWAGDSVAGSSDDPIIFYFIHSSEPKLEWLNTLWETKELTQYDTVIFRARK